MLTPAQLITLKAQLDTTYVGLSNGTVLVEINDPTGPNSIPAFDVELVTNTQLVASVVGTEFTALTGGEQRAWLMITNLLEIPVKDTAIRALIQDIWAAGTTTRTNLVALQTRAGSHAEALFAQPVTIDDIRAARLV